MNRFFRVSTTNGPLLSRSFCKQTDSAVAKIRELGTRSRSRSEKVDSFTLDWNQLGGYVFPPFAPTGRSLVLVPFSLGQLTLVPSVVRNDNRQSHTSNIIHPFAHLQLSAWLVPGFSSFTVRSKTALDCMESEDRQDLFFGLEKADWLLWWITGQSFYSNFRINVELLG